MALAPNPFPLRFGEGDIRRLCGHGTFQRADLLERAGHVLGASVDGAALSGRVRGTWRRVDQVSIGTRGGQLVPMCRCGLPGFCQHAGALALHWLRAPSDFRLAPAGMMPAALPAAGQRSSTPNAPALTAFDDDFDLDLDAVDYGEAEDEVVVRTPEEELQLALERDRANHLRQIATARGVRLSGSAKVDLVQQLVPVLLDPGSIDAALARLGPRELRLVDAAYLVGRVAPLTPALLQESFALLGGEGAAPMEALFDLGLLVLAPGAYAAQPCYLLPVLVGARLPALRTLVPPHAGPEPAARPPSLDIMALVQLVASELAATGGELRTVDVSDAPVQLTPEGYEWRFDRRAHEPLHDLVPIPSPLAESELERLASRLGTGIAEIGFAVELLFTLGILEIGQQVTVRRDLLQSYTRLGRGQQLRMLAAAWLQLLGYVERTILLGEGGPLALRVEPQRLYYATYGAEPHVDSWVAAGELLLTSVFGRLESGVWYDTWTVAERLWPLVRLTLRTVGLMSRSNLGPSPWQLVERAGPHQGQALSLNAAAQAERFFPFLLGACLGGALHWLGLVELADGGEPYRPGAFRLRPAAGILGGREPRLEESLPVSALALADDLTLLVPPGGADAALQALLGVGGELVDVSTAGARYRLTVEGAQALFDAGTTGPELLAALEERGAALSPAARGRLTARWASYAQVRLYDELTLIELADDLLLPELLASTSLSTKLIHRFSPRLVAVDPAVVDELVAELTRLGHAPRVVEEA